MAKPLLTDALWQRIEPLLPPPKPRRFRFPGRQPISDRQALTSILFVLKTGFAWEYLPQEMGCGSGMTCWRRLRDWQQAGVWQRLHQVLLQELHDAERIDWERAAIDSSSVRSLDGGERTGKNPTDRAKLGTKHHLLVDGQGIPLAAEITGANTHDVQGVVPLLCQLPDVDDGTTPLPKRLYGDRSYDSEGHRQLVRWLEMEPFFANVARLMEVAWACFVGWWNARWAGYTTSVAFGFVANNALTFIARFSISAVRSSR